MPFAAFSWARCSAPVHGSVRGQAVRQVQHAGALCAAEVTALCLLFALHDGGQEGRAGIVGDAQAGGAAVLEADAGFRVAVAHEEIVVQGRPAGDGAGVFEKPAHVAFGQRPDACTGSRVSCRGLRVGAGDLDGCHGSDGMGFFGGAR